MPWIAAGGAILGGVLGGMGSSSAAKKQQRAAESATMAQGKAYEEQVRRQEPFYNAGTAANNRLMELMGMDVGYDQDTFDQIYKNMRDQASAGHRSQYGFGYDDAPGWAYAGIAAEDKGLRERAMQEAKAQYQPGERSSDFGFLTRRFSDQDFEADPGYQFRMEEGMRGVEGSAAARGGLLSGAALKAIQKYGQGLASQEYGNAYQRFNADQTNQYNRLAGLVQSGQGAASQIGNAASQFGQQQGSNLIGAGNAQAAGIMGGVNALTGGINQGINNWQQNQLLEQNKQFQNNLMNLIRQPSSIGWGGGFYPYGGSNLDAGNVS